MKNNLQEENTKLKELLSLALEEMSPNCQSCVYIDGSAGSCANPCKWRHEDEARALIGGEK